MNFPPDPKKDSMLLMKTAPQSLSLTDRQPLLTLSESAAPVSPAYNISKRLLDIIGAAVLLALSFPLMLCIAIGILCTSRGPVLFRQVRLGRYGQEFWLFKFRTMVINAEQELRSRADLQEQFSASFKIANDPRITKIGAFLRKTSLDELPQFVNVLRGEMSLIGPRPIVGAELPKYGRYGEKLLTVKPGLGGLWQVRGRSNTTYAERVSLDMWYIDNQSLLYDLSLVVQTAYAVVICRGSF